MTLLEPIDKRALEFTSVLVVLNNIDGILVIFRETYRPRLLTRDILLDITRLRLLYAIGGRDILIPLNKMVSLVGDRVDLLRSREPQTIPIGSIDAIASPDVPVGRIVAGAQMRV